jgi:DNA-binding LacI/PurR family transcriptional regulator
MVDPYFAEIARGVEDAARRAGYLVVVCNTDREPAAERRYVATLSDYRVEALIFIGGDVVAAGEAAQAEATARARVEARHWRWRVLASMPGLPAIDTSIITPPRAT